MSQKIITFLKGLSVSHESDVVSWFSVGFHVFSRWFHSSSWIWVGFHGFSRWFLWFFMILGWFPWFFKVAGLHKLRYPGIQDIGTWSKFGAHGEHGDVFLFSNVGALWFSENFIRYSLHVRLREVKNNPFSLKHLSQDPDGFLCSTNRRAAALLWTY